MDFELKIDCYFILIPRTAWSQWLMPSLIVTKSKLMFFNSYNVARRVFYMIQYGRHLALASRPTGKNLIALIVSKLDGFMTISDWKMSILLF